MSDKKKSLPKGYMLYSPEKDRYYTHDEIVEYGMQSSTLCIAIPVKPRPFDMTEFFCKDWEYAEALENGYELPLGWEAVEKAVNDWLNSIPVEVLVFKATSFVWNGEFND